MNGCSTPNCRCRSPARASSAGGNSSPERRSPANSGRAASGPDERRRHPSECRSDWPGPRSVRTWRSPTGRRQHRARGRRREDPQRTGVELVVRHRDDDARNRTEHGRHHRHRPQTLERALVATKPSPEAHPIPFREPLEVLNSVLLTRRRRRRRLSHSFWPIRSGPLSIWPSSHTSHGSCDSNCRIDPPGRTRCATVG